jgi:hypothetical protein
MDFDNSIYRYMINNKNLHTDFIKQKYIPLLKKISNNLYINEDNNRLWEILNREKIDETTTLITFKEKSTVEFD